jgi:vesicle transport through interaction with t-SNAREs protein 1
MNDADRDQLLGGPSPESMAMDYESSRMDQRVRLLNGTETLAKSSKKLEDAHRIAMETGKWSYSFYFFIVD